MSTTPDVANLARDLASSAEAERRLPEALVVALREADQARAWVPAALGGAEASPADVLRDLHDLARADMSAGWCAAIAATTGLLAAYLTPAAGARAFGTPGSIACGVWAPRARAARDPDGTLRVSGRWAFSSAVTHADWFFGGALVTDARGTGEPPEMHIVGLPVSELEVHDTWEVGGLRGTGSHDTSVQDAIVPAELAIPLLRSAPQFDTALACFPVFGLFAQALAAVALGNARGAMDDLRELAVGKTPLGSGRTVADRATVQARVAEAEAGLRAAHALTEQAVAAAWVDAEAGGQARTEQRLGLRLSATHAVRTAARVADACHDLGGGSAIYASSPLQRRLRDAQTATAHAQVAPATWELTGRLLLDRATDIAQL